MATDPSFVPVFGPNGAVMNAPSMTPEMRAKIDEVGRLPSRPVLWRYAVNGAIYLVVFVSIATLGPRVHDLVSTSSWWAGLATGIAVSVLVLQSILTFRWAIRRWELMVPPAGRHLSMPSWARVSLAVSDVAAIMAYGAMLAGLLLRPALSEEFTKIAYITTLPIAGILGSLSMILRYMAEKLGWKWRAKR